MCLSLCPIRQPPLGDAQERNARAAARRAKGETVIRSMHAEALVRLHRAPSQAAMQKVFPPAADHTERT